MTIQVFDKRSRLFILGAYLSQGDSSHWSNLKEEIQQIRENFLNPHIIVAGDFNNFIPKVKKLAARLSLSEIYFEYTRRQRNGESEVKSQIDGIFHSLISVQKSEVEVPFSDHLLLVTTLQCPIKT